MVALNPEQQARLYALKQTIAVAGEKAFIDGRAYDALISDTPSALSILSGGMGEQGTFTITIPIDIMPREPEKHAEVKARGKKLAALSSLNRGGIAWEITAGDPAAGT